MPSYEYVCERCNKEIDIFKPMDECHTIERCPECETILLRQISRVNVVGTQDNFGIGKAFYDEKSGKTIDTWKKWEDAGYRDARDSSDVNVANEAKRKVEKIEKYDTGKKFSVGG